MTDKITPLLDLMRIRSTAFISKHLYAPWGVHLDKHPALGRFHIVLSGATWIGLPCGTQRYELTAGDIAIIPKGKAHEYFHDKTYCERDVMTFPAPGSLSQFDPFDPDSQGTHVLCGYFEISKSTPETILTWLPDIFVGQHDDPAIAQRFAPVIDLIVTELSRPDGASPTTLNRLTEILCVHTIYAWMEAALPANPHLQALSDPQLMRVLDAIHTDPYHPWTVDNLACLHGKSRSAFSAHFKAATGESPLSYIRTWRIKLACGLLKDPAMSLDEVAHKTGYSDTNAFNRAFKRAVGSPPGVYASGSLS